MATYEGSNGTVKVAVDGGSAVAVAEVRSWSADFSRDVVESTAMGDGHRVYKKGLQSYSGSMDIVYDDTSDADVSVALNPDSDNTITVEFYTNSTGSTQFAGEIIITSFSVSASYDGLVEASVSFTGNGAPTTAVFGS
jgi:predicted secreted protein